jgi:FtsP/CotA-like multicopper oxidase with cupredoxin domain
MKKLFFIPVSCLFLFFFYSFGFYDHPVLFSLASYKEQNIIRCSPATGNYGKTVMGPYFRPFTGSLEEISINDNRKAAGELRDGVLYLNLETRTGNWYPETHEGNPLQVYAFAEAGKPLQLPGPLIRVTEGTIINAEIHNTIPGSPLVLRGFYSRPGNDRDSVTIQYGETYKVQFKAGKAGTYFYWASSGADSLKETFTGLRLPYFNDSQLYGALL